MAKGKGNPSPKPPSSRGIPADESLYMPSHQSKAVREKGGLDEAVIWGVEDVVDFVFPKKYQPRYHEVASRFVELLLAKGANVKNRTRDGTTPLHFAARQGHAQIVGNTARKLPQRGQLFLAYQLLLGIAQFPGAFFHQLFKMVAMFLQFFLCLLALGDVSYYSKYRGLSFVCDQFCCQ